MDSPLFQIFYSGRRVSPIREGGGRDGKWNWYRRLDPFFDSSSRSLISFSFLRQFTYVYALSRPLAENSSSSSDFLCPMERRESRAQPLSLSFFLRRFLSPSSETDNFPPISPPPLSRNEGCEREDLGRWSAGTSLLRIQLLPPRMFPRTRSI